MSNPLNPDGVLAAGRLYGEIQACVDARNCAGCKHEAAEVTRAYLAVAQPEVNSVEELESYPLGTVFLDDLDDVMQHLPDGEGGSYWVRQGDFRYYDVTEVELPARVLHRPEVNDGR